MQADVGQTRLKSGQHVPELAEIGTDLGSQSKCKTIVGQLFRQPGLQGGTCSGRVPRNFDQAPKDGRIRRRALGLPRFLFDVCVVVLGAHRVGLRWGTGPGPEQAPKVAAESGERFPMGPDLHSSTSGRRRLNFRHGPCWPILAEIQPSLGGCGQCWSKFGQCWSTLAKSGVISTQVVRIWPILPRCWPLFVEFLHDFDRCWASMANSVTISTKLGRICEFRTTLTGPTQRTNRRVGGVVGARRRQISDGELWTPGELSVCVWPRVRFHRLLLCNGVPKRRSATGNLTSFNAPLDHPLRRTFLPRL